MLMVEAKQMEKLVEDEMLYHVRSRYRHPDLQPHQRLALFAANGRVTTGSELIFIKAT